MRKREILLSLVVFGSIPFMAYQGEKGYREHDERVQRQQAQQGSAANVPAEGPSSERLAKPQS